MFDGCSFILPISQGASEVGRGGPVSHMAWPKVSKCLLCPWRPQVSWGHPSQWVPSLLRVCVEQDPHHGVSPRPCSLTAAWRQ